MKYLIKKSNKRTPRYMKQKQTKLNGKIDNAEVIVGDFNPPFSMMNRQTTKKIAKDIEDLNNTINHQN